MKIKKKNIWISIGIIAAVVLAFHYYPRQQGYIKIDTAGVEMQLHGGWFSKTRIASGAEPATVKARVYSAGRMSITAKQDGDTWRINSFGPWGKLAKIKVKENETTVLELGPPLLIKPSIRKSSSLVSIGLSIIGQAGEHYSTTITKNARGLPAPGLKIVDEAGNVLASGKFEYG